MALPKIKHPIHKATIPSIKKEISFRPFTVQEEKLLLMAKASEKTEDIITTVKQVLQNCIIDSVDVDMFATFDIEYLFIKLRSKSVGEFVDLEYDDMDTGEKVNFKVNLDEVEIKHHKDHNKKITLHQDIGVVMRYPTLEEIKNIESDGNSESSAFQMLLDCIEKIYDNDTVYDDYTKDELNDFINTLPIDSLEKIKIFFETMPSVEHEVQLKNKKGETKTIVLKGINSFFM